MGALLLRSRSTLPVDAAWTWSLRAAPSLPTLIAGETARLALVIGRDDPVAHTLDMELHHGAGIGHFQLMVVDAGDGQATLVWSGEVPEPIEDELEAVLALQTAFRRWALSIAQPETLEPG